MAAVDRPRYPQKDVHLLREKRCLEYHGMLSLHDVFEVVGSQLTETDIEVLSFLVNEMYESPHPSDLAKPDEEDESEEVAVAPNPRLVKARERLNPRRSQGLFEEKGYPSNGFELLLELEKQGYLSDGNLQPLLELLRVLTRHDLLHLVSRKRRRTVSPDRTENCSDQWKDPATLPLKNYVSGRKKKKRGHGWSHKPKRRNVKDQPVPPQDPQYKTYYSIRLTIRIEYVEHEATLRGTVSSNKQEPLERKFDLFNRATSVLHSRDLGCIMCNIKFTDRDSLDAFWRDYLQGDLLEALKAVFITNTMRLAVGGEEVCLLISVSEDDYTKGRRLLKPASRKRSYTHICLRHPEMTFA